MQELAHYLESKRTVDDRALNRRVLEHLRRELEAVDRPAIADIGAGIGTGIERLRDWGVVDNPRYTAVEPNEALVDIARSRATGAHPAEYIPSTLAQFAADPKNRDRFDLVIAHALLDIVDLPESLRHLVNLSRPHGLLYLPITYDGESIFEPAHEDDETILESYHRAMDAGGQSRAGRKLFHALTNDTVEILAMGSSDWIVRPAHGTYPDDERFFLEQILTMFERTVGEPANAWLATRRQQLRQGQLLYLAHQLDYLAKKLS